MELLPKRDRQNNNRKEKNSKPIIEKLIEINIKYNGIIAAGINKARLVAYLTLITLEAYSFIIATVAIIAKEVELLS